MNRIRIPLLLILTLSWVVAGAGTLIESREDDGSLVKMRISDTMARIDSGDPEAYMVVDLKAGKVYVVSPTQRMVLEMAAGADPGGIHSPRRPVGPAPEVEVNRLGVGERVAGYETRRYRVSAAGRHCFDDLISTDLLDLPGMRRFAEVMAAASGEPEDGTADPCAYAMEVMGQRYADLGVPLKTVEADGRVSHEIIKVVTDVDFPQGIFILPADYRQVDQRALMRQAEEAMANMPHGPDGMPSLPPGMSEEDLEDFRRQMQQEIQREMQQQ